MRDRLIELLKKIDYVFDNDKRPVGDCEEYTADYLIANGVVCPPVKVGDKVYCLYQECQKETEIIELEIDTIEIHKEYIIINGYKGEHCYRYFLSEIGKTVFLTKEEAEKALKESVQE